MGFNIKYKVLFSIDVLHHYFLDLGHQHFESLNAEKKVRQLGQYDVRRFLELIPTKECKALMKQFQLVSKATSTGIIVGSPVNEAGTHPAIEIPSTLKFGFIIKMVDPLFFNYTNLPLQHSPNQKFYFSNLDQENTEILNLSAPTDIFQNGATYNSGTLLSSANGRTLFSINRNTSNAVNAELTKDFVAAEFANNESYSKADIVVRTIGGIDQLFESKIDNPNDTPNDVPGNDWKKLRDLPLNYVNKNDSISMQSPFFNFTLANDSINATVELFSKDSSGNQLVQQDKISAGTTNIHLDWSSHSSGQYTVKITNDDLAADHPDKTIHESSFFLADSFNTQNAFGFIEIHTERSDTNKYALLNENGSFQNTENQYVIRFKNRSTIWRYKFNASQSLQGNSDFGVENSDDKILITNELQPLTANGLVALQIGDFKLPNASPKLIKPENENIYSEIFIYQ